MPTVDQLHSQSEHYANLYGIPGTGVNDARDAFRHAYSSAVLAREWGAGLADTAGTFWEVLGLILGDSSEAESRMDAYNNYVGRKIQQRLGPNATNDQIAADVKRALDEGGLVTEPGRNRFDPSQIQPKTVSQYELARAPQRRDPLAVDLDQDGVETTGVTSGAVIKFDHDGDGVKTGTGWLRPDDGWLVRDLNSNGTT
jgi:hypothetical protein